MDELATESATKHSRHRPARPLVANRLKIAIDGPAGAGKSTVAKRVADLLGYLYIDTGAMYRAVTWLALTRGIQISDRAKISKLAGDTKIELKPGTESGAKVRVFVNGEEITKEIRSQSITRNVSTVSAIAAVREHLVNQQRELAKIGGVVLDGRDIGTIVLPDADLKIFLTASPEVRAHRRMEELRTAGELADYKLILQDIIERDQRDSNRVVSPLRMADDAILILTDNMSIDDVVSHIVHLIS